MARFYRLSESLHVCAKAVSITALNCLPIFSLSLFSLPLFSLSLAGFMPTLAQANQVESVNLSNGSVLIMDVPDSKAGNRSADSTALAVIPHNGSDSDDLIARLRTGFNMPPVLNNRVDRYRQSYVGKQEYVNRLLERASHYLYLSISEAERRGLPTELALLPVIESAYDPLAVSRSQAAGIWQFVPDTGRLYGLKQTAYYDGRRDPMESTRAAYDYLSQLYQTFGSWELVLASYNAGPGTVSRAMKHNAALGLPTDYWSLNLPAETMGYVPRFLAVVELFRNPQAFNVSMPSLTNRPYFRTVSMQGPMTLNDIAEITGIDARVLHDLNPGLRRDATDPQGPYHVHVPATLDISLENLLVQRAGVATQVVTLPVVNPSALATAMKVSANAQSATSNVVIPGVVTRYRVLAKDTWYAVARQFAVAPAALMASNNSNGQDPLVIGRELIIPDRNTFDHNNSASAVTLMNVSSSTPVGDQRIELKRKVMNGETLESISQQYQVTLSEIRAWNGDLSSNLRPGQLLTLRVSPGFLNTKSL